MDDQWLYIEAKRQGRPYMAAVRHPLADEHRAELDHHVAIALDYAPQWRNGLPKPKELLRLQELEDGMIARLDGHGVVAASETGDARRVVHVFLGEGAVLDLFRSWAARGRQGGVEVTVARDPQWAAVGHLAQYSARAAA